MAGVSNHYVQQVIAEMDKLFEDGFWAGLEHKGPMPAFMTKPAYTFKPYERGYWYGMQTKRIEREYAEAKQEGARVGFDDLGIGGTLTADDSCWLSGGE